jgi:predicted protein tyrosine phosphatase
MPFVTVCPLSQVAATVAATDASHLVSLINIGTAVARPEVILEANHLFLGMNDILAPQEGMIAPGREHVESLLAFVAAWDRARPMVVHCYAGISRSTAGAFISLCAARPDRNEAEVARRLRTASPTATPNALLVAIADALLDRRGRMVAAIAAIGQGELAAEGVPFRLSLEGSG